MLDAIEKTRSIRFDADLNSSRRLNYRQLSPSKYQFVQPFRIALHIITTYASRFIIAST